MSLKPGDFFVHYKMKQATGEFATPAAQAEMFNSVKPAVGAAAETTPSLFNSSLKQLGSRAVAGTKNLFNSSAGELASSGVGKMKQLAGAAGTGLRVAGQGIADLGKNTANLFSPEGFKSTTQGVMDTVKAAPGALKAVGSAAWNAPSALIGVPKVLGQAALKTLKSSGPNILGAAAEYGGGHAADAIAGTGGGYTGTSAMPGLNPLIEKNLGTGMVGTLGKGVARAADIGTSFIPPVAAAKGLTAAGSAVAGRATAGVDLPTSWGTGQPGLLGPTNVGQLASQEERMANMEAYIKGRETLGDLGRLHEQQKMGKQPRLPSPGSPLFPFLGR
jgi:hypothetical protein